MSFLILFDVEDNELFVVESVKVFCNGGLLDCFFND